MNVAWTPCDAATSRTAKRNVITLSAIVKASVWRRSISCWLGVLVEAVLDGDAHRLERADRLLAQRAGDVVGGEVEEAGVVERLRCGTTLGRLEVEELDVRSDVEDQALLVGGLDVALEHVAAVAVEGRAVEVVDVAEDPRLGRRGVAEGQQLERVGIRHRQDVGFLDP